MVQHILLFGLSANPPTYLTGHFGIAKYFAGMWNLWSLGFTVFEHRYLRPSVDHSGVQTSIHFKETIAAIWAKVSTLLIICRFFRIRMLELSLEDMQDENKDKIHVSMIEKEAFHSYYPNHPFDDPSIKVSFSNPKNALVIVVWHLYAHTIHLYEVQSRGISVSPLYWNRHVHWYSRRKMAECILCTDRTRNRARNSWMTSRSTFVYEKEW